MRKIKNHIRQLYFQSHIIVLLCVIHLCSCVNLRHVSDFTESSLEGIDTYEQLPHSFTKSCLDTCEQNNIEALKIHGTNCDCTSEKKADSITRLIYKTTRAYFYGLGRLSNGQLTNYQTDELSQVLTTGNFGPISLNETDVNAYSDISALVLRAFTDGYRRNKIKQYIAQANAPLQTLLKFLNLNLSGNLKGKLEVEKASLKNFYFDLVANTDLSLYERTKFAQEYFKRIEDLNAKQREIDAYSEVLKTISEGHNTLYSNINALSTDEIRSELETYGVQIRSATYNFNRTNYELWKN